MNQLAAEGTSEESLVNLQQTTSNKTVNRWNGLPWEVIEVLTVD